MVYLFLGNPLGTTQVQEIHSWKALGKNKHICSIVFQCCGDWCCNLWFCGLMLLHHITLDPCRDQQQTMGDLVDQHNRQLQQYGRDPNRPW